MKLQSTPFSLNIISLFVLAGLFIAPFMVYQEGADSIRMGKIFFFLCWMLLQISFGLIVFISNWRQPIDNLSLLVFAWAVWMMLRGKFGGIWHDENFIWISGCFVFFFLTVAILTNVFQKGQIKLLLIPVFILRRLLQLRLCSDFFNFMDRFSYIFNSKCFCSVGGEGTRQKYAQKNTQTGTLTEEVTIGSKTYTRTCKSHEISCAGSGDVDCAPKLTACGCSGSDEFARILIDPS